MSANIIVAAVPENNGKEWWHRKGWRCDGNHGGPPCADTDCWNDDPRLMSPAPLRHFNPACAHDRTSYSINTCDACRAFSEPLNARATPHHPV